MRVQNLKLVALPIPEIIGSTKKIRHSHSPFSPEFLRGFCLDGHCEYTCQISSSYSFTGYWDNRGYSKNLGSPCIRPRSLFSKIVHGLVFGWTLWIFRPNLQSVALAVPEIITIAVLGWGCKPSILGNGRPYMGSGIWYRSIERLWLPIDSP